MIFDQGIREILAPVAEVIGSGSFSEYFKEYSIVFAGDGAFKCRGLFSGQPKAIFSDIELPSAAHMISLAEEANKKSQYEDVALFEPYYLKDFIAGRPGVKGLK